MLRRDGEGVVFDSTMMGIALLNASYDMLPRPACGERVGVRGGSSTEMMGIAALHPSYGFGTANGGAVRRTIRRQQKGVNDMK